MWPSISEVFFRTATRLPSVCASRTSLFYGDKDKEQNSHGTATFDFPAFHDAVDHLLQTSSSGVNFAAAASASSHPPLRCVTTATALDSPTHPTDTEDLSISTDVEINSKTTVLPATFSSSSIRFKDPPRTSSTRPMLEGLLKTNFCIDSPQRTICRATSPGPYMSNSSDMSFDMDAEDDLSSPLSPSPSMCSESSTNTMTSFELTSLDRKYDDPSTISKKQKRKELNKLHARNYRRKMKEEQETLFKTCRDLEDKNTELRQKVQELEEKKEWISSYLNMMKTNKSKEVDPPMDVE